MLESCTACLLSFQAVARDAWKFLDLFGETSGGNPKRKAEERGEGESEAELQDALSSPAATWRWVERLMEDGRAHAMTELLQGRPGSVLLKTKANRDVGC